MKKICVVIVLFFVSSWSQAQVADKAVQEVDTAWRSGGFVNLNFSQVSVSNWAAGGENAISVAGLGNLFLNYITVKRAWETSLDLAYGLTKTGDQDIRKFDDKIEFNSKYGQQIKGKWYLTGLVNFKTQFQPGYNYYDNDSNVLLSKFFSPATVLLSVGIDWKPKDYFSLYFSPATGKLTFVTDQTLADQGAFGVDPLTVDQTTGEITKGKNLRAEFGAYVSMKFKKEIWQNVGVETKLDLFDNYTDKVASNRDNVDVNWTVLVSMKINKFLVASLSTELIYDHNTPVPLYSKDANGDKFQTGTGPRTQFKEVLAVGLAYKF